ncbi:hypothetical protein ACR784_22385 [Sphingobacterium multivorum]|uniref:Uncharacterized protein n=1 Tax=Sphingobacterium thalpophilum TaxID=259 RepID=A0ACD5C8X3_9SPHI
MRWFSAREVQSDVSPVDCFFIEPFSEFSRVVLLVVVAMFSKFIALELFKIERPSNRFGSTSNVITYTSRVYSDEDV